MESSFWTSIIISILVGVIIVIVEHFIIQPLARKLERRSENHMLHPQIEKNKLRRGVFKNFLQNATNKLANSILLRKAITLLAEISLKSLLIALIAFSIGIVFTIFIARVTGTNLAKVEISSTNQIPTPGPERNLLIRTNSTRADVVFLVDIAYVMESDDFQQAQRVMFDFGQKLISGDKVEIIISAYETEVIFPLAEAESASGDYLKAINSISNYAGYGGRLYDGVVSSLEQLDIDKSRKRLLIVFTSGQDFGSHLTRQAVANTLLSRQDVTAVFIVLQDDTDVSEIKALSETTNSPLYFWVENQNPWLINDIINTYIATE